MDDAVQKALHFLERRYEQLAHAFRERVGYFDPIRVVAYRGYGRPDRMWLRGRVLADDAVEPERDPEPLDSFMNMMRRYETDEVPGARVRVRFQDFDEVVQTDDEGFFQVEIVPTRPLDPKVLWHRVRCTLLEPKPHVDQQTVDFWGHVQVPQDPQYGIISDIDDTVVYTGATNLFEHAWVVMLNSARSRLPFQGGGALYRGFQRDAQGTRRNPIWYVSASPWNLYDLFYDFMTLHDVPHGAMLLRDNEQRLLHGGKVRYKFDHIQRILDRYPDLRFILIGDSGQKDPEIYRDIVHANPDRILAIYIRDVASEARDEEVQTIAAEVRSAGVEMLLLDDTVAAARHAAENGWIASSAIDEVREEKASEEESAELRQGLDALREKIQDALS